jgi:hypothetical protein
MTGLAPTAIQVSAVSKVCSPACQLPCRATEVCSAGLSMVAAENTMREPMARKKARASGVPTGWDTGPVPLDMAIDRGPCAYSRALTCCATLATISCDASSVNEPSVPRCRQRSTRAGSLCWAGSARPLGHV